MNKIYQISELTKALKNLLEGQFPFIWVRGQVSSLSRPSSGHLYFSLKDEDSSISAVWFKGNQQEQENFDPLTGEVFEHGPRTGLASTLENGMEIICAGSLTVYPPRGNYQIVVELAQDAGKGRLQLEFELLQAELAKKGYFDPLRKRPLPVEPVRVAVVTSPRGAAIYDFLRIAAGRGLPAEIRIYPTLVQGEDAPDKISSAINVANSDGWAELIVLIRGGGSLEDLWAFNSREVATAIFNSNLPVLCGVGHEVDISLADLVADVRAATPSHAAQLLWKERRELAQGLDEVELRLYKVILGLLERYGSILERAEKSLRLLSPTGLLERTEITLENCWQRLTAAMHNRLERAESRLENSITRLAGLDPELPLRRGYALVRKMDGRLLRSKQDTTTGEFLDLQLVDGTIPVVVRKQD